MKTAWFLGSRCCILGALLCGNVALSQQAPRPIRHIAPHMLRPAGQVSFSKAAAAGPSLPLWTTTAGSYTYTMVGQSPLTAGSNGTTTIDVPIVPLAIEFADGTVLDPTASDTACSPAGTGLALTMASPIFGNFNYTAGGANVGSTQYLDFFQRANYWQYTNSKGLNPNYHLLLNPIALSPIRIVVPADQGSASGGNYCGKLGEIQVDWFNSYLQNSVFPQLTALGVTPATFPIFLTYNVLLYTASPDDCCIGGFHTWFANPAYGGARQTYAMAAFDTVGGPGNSNDVAFLSHEVGEWMDDPSADNPVPPWGNIGETVGCQSNLEVGDPLQINVPVTMPNGVAYHVQELAFTSWFYGQSPSTGVNGWYSSNGTFRTAAAPCVDGPTVRLNPGTVTFVGPDVGSTSSAGSVTLTNTGKADLSSIVIAVTGANPSDFAQTNTCPGSLAVNAGCTISVVFKPTAPGARTAVVSISDNAPNSPQNVNLSGTASGTGFSNQRVTKDSPPVSGCTTPTAASSFSTQDQTVYLWFNATVTSSDELTSNWLAPDGAVIAGKTWSGNQGSFCFSTASLGIGSLPTGRLGSWQARLYDHGALLFSVPFTVSTPGSLPAIGAVINAASGQPQLASGTWMSVLGSNLAPNTPSGRLWGGGDFAGNKLPTSLDGVSVMVNGRRAYVYFISPAQINFLSPVDAASGGIAVQVTTSTGQSNTFTVQKQAVSPALFMFSPQSSRYAIGLFADGAYAGPPGLFGAGVTVRAPKPGDTIVMYATGLGATAPAYPDGTALAPGVLYQLADPVTVQIGGTTVTPLFVGLVFSGEYQLNVTIPNLPVGDAAVVVNVGGKASQTGAYLSIGR
jgi:uncharacterized protein (TIGR03437 family)